MINGTIVSPRGELSAQHSPFELMDVIQEGLGGILLSFHATLKEHKQVHGPLRKPDATLPVSLDILMVRCELR